MSIAINRIFTEARDPTGPLDWTERAAAITVCDRALATYPDGDMAFADAAGILGMLGLLRKDMP
jgi:hypothetical protein